MNHLFGTSTGCGYFPQVKIGKKIERISVEQGDPGYLPYQELRAGGQEVKIFLDGVEQELCVMADVARGEIKRNVRNEKGKFFSYAGDIANETVHGVVRIEIY